MFNFAIGHEEALPDEFHSAAHSITVGNALFASNGGLPSNFWTRDRVRFQPFLSIDVRLTTLANSKIETIMMELSRTEPVGARDYI